ncbi:phage portal protein BeeE [Xanthomonas arboricola]
MSTRKQFRVCTGVTLCFKMMQGHVLAMLHSHARPGLPPILIACEAAGLALAGQPVTC